MTPQRRALLVAIALVAGALAPRVRAAIPAPPSHWYGLPGLNAACGAQWVRAIAYGTPPNVVYAGLEGGGVFRSTNGGATWSAFNSGFPNPLITNVRALLTSTTGRRSTRAPTTGHLQVDRRRVAAARTGAGGRPGQPEEAQRVRPVAAQPHRRQHDARGRLLRRRLQEPGRREHVAAARGQKRHAERGDGLRAHRERPRAGLRDGGQRRLRLARPGLELDADSDGIPGSASPITTWAYPQKPQILFTSTGSNGIYRSLNAGLTWSPINYGLVAVRARGFQIFTATQGAHLYAATENGLWEALTRTRVAPAAARGGR